MDRRENEQQKSNNAFEKGRDGANSQSKAEAKLWAEGTHFKQANGQQKTQQQQPDNLQRAHQQRPIGQQNGEQGQNFEARTGNFKRSDKIVRLETDDEFIANVDTQAQAECAATARKSTQNESLKTEIKQAETTRIDVESEPDEEVIVVSCDQSDELTETKKRIDEMTNHIQRLQAEFDNYRKRTQESMKAVKNDARIDLIEKLLPALDAFGQAAQIIKDKSVLDGVNMISARIMDVLSQFGLTKIDAAGKEFDPNFHNAVLTRAEAGQEDKVVDVLQDGYILGGKVIRAASVIVGC